MILVFGFWDWLKTRVDWIVIVAASLVICLMLIWAGMDIGASIACRDLGYQNGGLIGPPHDVTVVCEMEYEVALPQLGE